MKLKAKAYAKLNLYLDVLGVREDGYHDIDSIMQSISLYDEIEIKQNDSGKVRIQYQDPSFSREDDIILRACNAFFDFSGWSCGLDIYIEKYIPTVAGLGGFSADVASVFKMLNIISGKNFSNEEILPLCTSLGADVPFCYIGGTARVGSIGDKIQSLATPSITLVLLKEGEKQSTGAMYGKLDSLALKPSDKIGAMLKGIENRDSALILASTYNIFENCWSFDEMKMPFAFFAPDTVFLSGSGPTVVAAFKNSDAAEHCYKKMKADGRNVFLATTVNSGIVIE